MKILLAMDDKEVRIDSGLATSIHNVCTKRLQNGNISYTNRDKTYPENIAHPLGKSDTRPCAIIGPDRVLPTTNSADVYMKTIPVDPWECSDNYRYPYDSIKMADYHQTRNISPRQTFQENMQRIMVPPTYSSIKNSDEPSIKNVKLNVPTEGKYCDVPYTINTLSSEQKSVRSDSAMATINPSFSRGWHASGGMQPMKPYTTHDYYQNTEYSTSCTGPRPMPIVQPQRIVHDELLPIYPDRLYQESNIRFKPYPTSKEKFSQSTYEYANTFQPPSQIPLHKFDAQKPMHGHPYAMYPQGPYKYIDRRYPEPMMENYPRPPHPQSNTFHNHNLQGSYGPLPSNFYQAKPYPCPSENPKPMHINKLSYDANNKIYLELENSRTKGYPSPDNYFYNDRAKFMRADILVPHNTPMNGMVPQHFYRKDLSQKPYDHVPHYRHRDPHMHLTNPLSRLPMQFSPNTIAISPCDSNNSNDTQGLGSLQEDCGYASQSSTTSVKSRDSNNGPIDYYKRQGYNFTSATQHSTLNGNVTSKTNSSDKRNLNVRQFLQMWNEGDDEEPENNNEVQNSTNYVSPKTPANSSQEQLYVLGSVPVPKEELSKYEHLQKVSKLPENIKGYNNIEILNQFEQLVESPNARNFHVKKPSTLKEYKVISKSFTKNHSKEEMRRPVSPLDVEAKISQSVIHKEVGCNFEIKPCSPKVLNVDVAAPVHDILGERLIEKVANPVLLNIGRGKETKVDKPVDESVEVTSCKMINASCPPNNSATVKPIYPLQDLDTNMGVCLASLPQLDNEIELNLPEVNQQFIDANKIETSCSPHPNLPIIENQDNCFVKSKINFSPNCDGQVNTYSEPDKETIKLSKYRKTKKVEAILNNYNSPNRVSLTQRTDSVIIKNPENVKIQNENLNSFDIENSVANNIPNEISKPELSNLFGSDNIVETAIDFSLNRSEPILAKENNESHCNLSTSVLIEDSDFYKNNIDLSITSEKSKEMEDCKIVYNNKNIESSDWSPALIHDNGKDSIDIVNCEDNSKLNNKIEDNLTSNKLQSKVEFYDYKPQNHDNVLENESEKVDRAYNNTEHNQINEKSEKMVEINNYDDNLPDLISEPILTKHSDNIYSQLNNSINSDDTFHPSDRSIDQNETKELHTISNHTNDEINKTVLTSELNCSSFPENFNFHRVSSAENNVDDGKSCNIDILSKIATETSNSECYNNEIFVSMKENEEVVNECLTITRGSDNKDLESENISNTAHCEGDNEMLFLEKAASSEVIEVNNTCSTLVLSKDENQSDVMPENTAETSSTKSSIATIPSSLPVNSTSEEEIKNEKESLKEIDVTDNIIEMIPCKIDDKIFDVSITGDTERHKSSNITKINTEDNTLLSENEMKTPLYTMDKDILPLEVSPVSNFDIDDKSNHETRKIMIKEIDNSSSMSLLKTSYNFNETYTPDVATDILSNNEIGDRGAMQSLVVNKNNDSYDDEKVENDFETGCEDKKEDSVLNREENENPTEDLCIKHNSDELKNKNDNMEQPPLNIDKKSNINYRNRSHKKALFSPWIQNLILYNVLNPKENIDLSQKVDIQVCNLPPIQMVDISVKNDSETSESVLNEELGEMEEVQNFLKECDYEQDEILMGCENKLSNSSNDIETNSRLSSECEQNKMSRCTSPLILSKKLSKVTRRTSKRSLSDSAIERYIDESDEQLSCKKSRKCEEGFVQSQIFASNLCNILQANRRNSISSICNDVFILIDKDLIVTEDSENHKVCFTDLEAVGDTENYCKSINTMSENLPQEDKELWVDEVAHMETIFSDDIAEDVEISTPSSPNVSISNYETVNNTSFMLCEEVIKNMENDVDYELNMSKEYSIDTSCDFPETQINEIFTSLESQSKDEICSGIESESNENKEENNTNHLEKFSNTIIENDDRILDDKENLEVDNNLLQESTINLKFDDYSCQQNPCDCPKYSSSPEVTSTTHEYKNPAILLKISSHKGSKVSQIENKKSTIQNTISYKLTEKKNYKNSKSNFNSSGTLITKAAQKYIPPIKISMSDLKVKLPLPKNSLDKLKQLKNSKGEPKMDKKSLKTSSLSTPRQQKKQKPKFEDVLMSIDEFQYSKPKVKNKKIGKQIPKVVIKKNETGSHYTSSCCSNDHDRNDPDLTGRKWQPWVFLEKNNFIDKMALRNKVKAIYCRRKKTFVFAEKFRKYKSVYNAKFVISQPKTNDLKKGNLKYTIRLKHSN